MNKEEKEFFYSIGRGSLNLNGKFYYGLDYSITDFMNSLEQQCKKQKETIDKAIELLNNPWSFESGNKEVDEITYNKKRKVIDILKEGIE